MKEQIKKPGKVLRADEASWKLLSRKRKMKETVAACLRRRLGLPPKGKGNSVREIYVLPSDIHGSVEEARGQAVLRAVKKKTKQIEEPILVVDVS
jgi:hypothetical protein